MPPRMPMICPHCGAIPRPSAKPRPGLINCLEIGNDAAQHLAHRDDALRSRIDRPLCELFRRNVETSEHLRRIKIDQQRSLIKDQIAFEKSASPTDLTAFDLNIVARPIACGHAQLLQSKGRRLADAARHLGKISHAQRCTIKNKLPANLTFIEIKPAATGDATDCSRCGSRCNTRA